MAMIQKYKSNILLRLLFYCYMSIAIPLAFICAFISQVFLVLVFFPLYFTRLRIRYVALGTILRFFNALFVVWLNPFWKIIVVRGPPKGYKPYKTIVTVNHTSNADPWICCSSLFPWETKYVLKKDLLNIPLLGWSIYLAGDIPIHFTTKRGGWATEPGCVKNVMSHVLFLQSLGVPQIVFPEGTRSLNGRLKLFKDGFFRLAVENNIEILPFVIHNARELWPMGSYLPNLGTAYVAFGNPILPQENDTAESLKTTVRQEMIRLLEMCPLYQADRDGPLDEYAEIRGHGIYGSIEESNPSTM